MTRYFKPILLTLSLYGCAVAFAQDPSVTPPAPPLPPASLPSSWKGVMDLIIKMMPFVWGIASPLIVGLIHDHAPKAIRKLPTTILPLVSGALGALGGAITGAFDTVLLDGGGVTSDTGALQGGTSGVAAAAVMQREPVKAEDEPKKTKEAVA